MKILKSLNEKDFKVILLLHLHVFVCMCLYNSFNMFLLSMIQLSLCNTDIFEKKYVSAFVSDTYIDITDTFKKMCVRVRIR